MGEDSLDLPQGTLDLLILKTVALEPQHGWAIALRIQQFSSEALRMIQKQRFDVVFMDVHMPGMNGYSAIRSIRDWETQTSNARTPVVVLSSDDLETQYRSATHSGCTGFLRKPLRRSALTDLLYRLKEARMMLT